MIQLPYQTLIHLIDTLSWPTIVSCTVAVIGWLFKRWITGLWSQGVEIVKDAQQDRKDAAGKLAMVLATQDVLKNNCIATLQRTMDSNVADLKDHRSEMKEIMSAIVHNGTEQNRLLSILVDRRHES